MIEIIPAIDLINGKCVRLTEGDYNRVTTYGEEPLAIAMKFQDAGVQRVHVVDLDGARAGSVQNLHILEQLASRTKLRIDFGGGIQTEAELRGVFDAGAAFATIGSLAVKRPEEFQRWIAEYDTGRFFIGADVRNERISVSGWAEQTDIPLIDFLQEQMSRRLHYFFCTDISRDGKLEGPSFGLYKQVIAQCPGIRLVASGGVATVDDIIRLEETGCEGVIVGKAIYENKITLKDIEQLNLRTIS